MRLAFPLLFAQPYALNMLVYVNVYVGSFVEEKGHSLLINGTLLLIVLIVSLFFHNHNRQGKMHFS